MGTLRPAAGGGLTPSVGSEENHSQRISPLNLAGVPATPPRKQTPPPGHHDHVGSTLLRFARYRTGQGLAAHNSEIRQSVASTTATVTTERRAPAFVAILAACLTAASPRRLGWYTTRT